MFFKKGYSGGFYKKASDYGHLGIKVLSHPLVSAGLNAYIPNSNVSKVSSILQKAK